MATKRQIKVPQWLGDSLAAYSTRERRSSPFLGLERSASLHSSLAAIGALVDVDGRPHLSPCLLPCVSVTHYNMDYYSLADPGGMEG